MASVYDYTMFKADGNVVVLGRGVAKKKWEELKQILNCGVLEIVPKDYVDAKMHPAFENSKRGEFYMDEEARLKCETCVRNPFFKVLKDMFGNEYDIVGDVILERKCK